MNITKQPIFQLQATITNEQLEFFTINGFIQFKNFVDKQTATAFIHEVKSVQDHLLRSKMITVNGIPLKFGKDINNQPLVQRLAFTSHFSNRLRNFLKDDRLKLLLQLLSPFEGRIGEHEKDGLVVNHYVNSPFSRFSQLGWHTDSPRDWFLGSRIKPMLNVGLHLDDCPFDNGGLRVLPGTHRQRLFGILFKKRYYVDKAADPDEVGFNINAGDLTVHDGRLWHRVQQSPNTGEQSRRRVMYIPIVTGAYQPKTTQSPTPFYHKVAAINMKKYTASVSWIIRQAKPESLAGESIGAYQTDPITTNHLI